MKTGIAVSVAFWASVAVFGFWGWAAFCTGVAVVAWALGKKGA